MKRVIVSHVYAQADGLRNQATAAPGGSSVEFALSVCPMDDASMWVKRPAMDVGVLNLPMAKKLKISFQRAGANVHLPVFNMDEDLCFLRRWHADTDSRVALPCTQVQSPSQVLAVPNTASVRYAWTSWAALSCSGTGSALDPGGQLRAAMDRVSWRGIFCCTDNLTLNWCIMALEERVLDAEYSNGRGNHELEATTLFYSGCCVHSGVLPMEPLIESQKLSTHLVRFAGLLQSGRRMTDFMQNLEREVEERFLYRRVAVMPDDFGDWAEYAERVLTLSRGAMDTDPTAEAFILNADNGNWKDWEMVHFCREDCPLQCNGDAAQSLRHMKAAVLLSIGGRMEKCLAYRWKGFEKSVLQTLPRPQTARHFLTSVCENLSCRIGETNRKQSWTA